MLLGACSSGSNDTASDETTTSTAAAVRSPYVTSFATARNATLTVLTSPPAGVTATTSPSTTTIPRSNVTAIPRAGLNSAGVKKTATGIEYTNPTYYKNPLVLQVLENQGDWIHVALLARPNHQTGWVKASDVELGTTDYRLELDLSTFTLRAYRADTVFLETKVAIGKDATPTPIGKFYLTEKIKNRTDTGFYGAWILPVSGYSETLDTFDGGLPQIALHGMNQPELLGTKVSNGCVRVNNQAISQLAEALPAGTPFEVFATTPASWAAASGSPVSAVQP